MQNLSASYHKTQQDKAWAAYSYLSVAELAFTSYLNNKDSVSFRVVSKVFCCPCLHPVSTFSTSHSLNTCKTLLSRLFFIEFSYRKRRKQLLKTIEQSAGGLSGHFRGRATRRQQQRFGNQRSGAISGVRFALEVDLLADGSIRTTFRLVDRSVCR